MADQPGPQNETKTNGAPASAAPEKKNPSNVRKNNLESSQ